MEITWYGHSCFRLAERGTATVVTDPHDNHLTGYGPQNLSADIVTISQDDPEHNYLEAVKGEPYIISGPGEYEVRGVFITGIHMGAHKGDGSEKNGGKYTLFAFDFDTVKVVHLGGLDRIPTQAEIEAIGTVNIAILPIEEGRSLSASKATEVISLLEPNIVIPIYDDPTGAHRSDSLTRFLKEMGINEITPLPLLKIASSSLPQETQVVLLESKRD